MPTFKNLLSYLKIRSKYLKKILLGFFSFAAATCIIFYLNLGTIVTDTKWRSFDEAILPDLFASMIVGFIATFIWGFVNKEEKKIEDEEFLERIKELGDEFFRSPLFQSEKNIFREGLFKEIHKTLGGLKEDEVNAVFNRAAMHIHNCNCIYVIGAAKQDQMFSGENNGVSRYLDATIERIRNGKKIIYKRITSLNLKDDFKAHLGKCFDANTGNISSNIEIMFLEDFLPSYTYLLIDNKFLMLSLNYPDQENENFCLYTEEENCNIILEYRNHFNRIWSEEEKRNAKVSNIDQFIYVHDYQTEALKEIQKIKNRINMFPKFGTLFQKNAYDDLKKFADKFDESYINSIKIDHNTVNENVISVFNNYLKLLKNGDTYKTITFWSFWKNLIPNKNLLESFVTNNVNALAEDAYLERVLIIDIAKIGTKSEENKKYEDGIRIIIRENVRILEYQPKYVFRLLFTSGHDFYENDGYNFAVVNIKERRLDISIEKKTHHSSNINEYIIFKPIRVNHEINTTEIIRNNQDELNKCNDKLNVVYREWSEKQNLSELKEFISSLKLEDELISKLIGRPWPHK